MSEFPLVWDSTMRGAFVACPKKFYWEFFRKLAISGTSIHLHFGKSFAAGCEQFRLSYYQDDASYEDAIAVGAKAIILEWGNFESEEKSAKNLYSCLEAYYSYFTKYHPKFDHIQPYIRNGKPAVEFTFAIPIPEVPHPKTGEPLIYAGRLDLLGLFNNQLFVVDEKTTTQLGPSWFRQWDLRAQFTGYCWAAKEFSLPVAGAIVRGTAIKATVIEHAEVITYRPEWHIKMWREQLARDLQRAVQCYETGTWDVNLDGACNSYGGCPFSRLCDSPSPERWIPVYYTTRHWNPLANDPTAPPEG